MTGFRTHPEHSPSSKWTICSGERGCSASGFAKVLQHKALSALVISKDFLFDQPKRRKSGLILKALQGRLWTPFLITSVA
jgi:hypothetical protein